MNVNLYGTQGKWLMVDLGLTFADTDYPGIDLILPELEFIEQRREELIGIVLTHGHEDHIGAIPYLAADLNVPLYATPFTADLIAGKLEEEGLVGKVKVHVIPTRREHRPRPVQDHLQGARPLDPRGQWTGDRNAARQHLPHRRLEDRRHAGAWASVERRGDARDRRPGESWLWCAIRPMSSRTRRRAPKPGSMPAFARRSKRPRGVCWSPPSPPTPRGCRR